MANRYPVALVDLEHVPTAVILKIAPTAGVSLRFTMCALMYTFEFRRFPCVLMT